MYTRRYLSAIRLMGYWPRNYEYISWVMGMWAEYRRLFSAPVNCSGMVEYQDAFDSWLESL